jgi:hypothetical protein
VAVQSGADSRTLRQPGTLLLISAFVVLATLNSAGYRFGASDQAFYVPAVLDRLDSTLFPRDSGLIASQARLTLVDETVAALARLTNRSLPVLFAGLYVVTLGLLAWNARRLGETLYKTRWAAVAFVAALTLRHAIYKTGTNSLEAYFHPRQLAFALGVMALGLFLRARAGLALGPLVPAAMLHPTTALWFVVWLAVAVFVEKPGARRPLALASTGLGAAGIWLVTSGPLAGRLAPMDQEWLATLVTKDYLFPLQWPATVWLLNLGYVPIIVAGYVTRRRAGLLVRHETGMVAGCLSLLAVFVAFLVLHTVPVALAVQMQPARVFWMLDFLATAYAVWWLAEGASSGARRAAIAAAAIALLSTGRGLYVAAVLYPQRPMAQIYVTDTDWGRVMAWARSSDASSAWMADPAHAALYGTSVRVAGERDVFVEEIKDTAIGLYDRAVAIRTRDRLAAIGPFDSLTAEHARGIGRRFGLDYLIADRPLDLPIAFQSGELRVYRLR